VYLFRTYDHPKKNKTQGIELNPGRAPDVAVWQVLRASTAAPTYFKPIKLGGSSFSDVSYMSHSNPTWVTYFEASQMSNDGVKALALTLSLGAGRPPPRDPTTKTGGFFLNRFLYSIRSALDAESKHLDMIRITSEVGTFYERFNVQDGLGRIRMDEWKIKNASNYRKFNETLVLIQEATKKYLDEPEVQARLKQVA
jgi:predicted acylesterase/phospholipase RssA